MYVRRTRASEDREKIQLNLRRAVVQITDVLPGAYGIYRMGYPIIMGSDGDLLGIAWKTSRGVIPPSYVMPIRSYSY